MTQEEFHISWSPPEGYQQVPSQVPGVLVYAPEPKTERQDQAKTYKCPNCGANLAYDVSTGGIACEYCGYIAPVRSIHAGRNADEFEFTLETVSQAERGWGEQRQVLNCESCGAALSLPQGALTNTCPFCASNQVNVTTCLDETLRPRFLIPFQIKPEQIQHLAAAWLGKGWFHPNELRSNAALRSIFKDIGAVVYYLKAIPWQVVGFDPKNYRDRLAVIHNIIEREGQFVATAHRFLILAQKKGVF